MALLDDLHRIVSVSGTENRIWAVKSALWIFERNPGLSLEQQAEGMAFLVAASLRETEAEVRDQYAQILSRITGSRPYQVGAQIDWASLTSALPQLPSHEVSGVLFLLRFATDERYLSLLESYFDDLEHSRWAISSWVLLASTQRYSYDKQVLSFLQEAQKKIEGRFAAVQGMLQRQLNTVTLTRHVINEHFADVQRLFWRESGTVAFTKKELQSSEQWHGALKAWAIQQFAEAEKHMLQHVQVRERTASLKESQEQKLDQAEPNDFPTMIQGWLVLPSREEKLHHLRRLQDTFAYASSLSLPIDEVAHCVKVLMDDALTEEDPFVNRLIWGIIAGAFEVHRYAGSRLDWDQLTNVLSRLNEEGETAQYLPLRSVLSCFGYASDERYLDVLKPYLDQSNGRVRWTAVEAIKNLLCHLAHYCSEVMILRREASDTLGARKGIPDTPERWQVIKDRLEQFEQDARSYFHSYSI